jgi:hypothetical protein
MYKLLMMVITFFSCSGQNTAQKSPAAGIGPDESILIEARVINIEPRADKFKLTVILEKESSNKAFLAGDTLSLFPNFMRLEGQNIQPDSPENQKMLSLKNLQRNDKIKATIKFRGSGKSQHGLIMDWSNK